jgi:hypothetical protein
MKKSAAEYEAPKLVVLGTVAELTLLDASGPNPDLAGFSPSIPVP